MLSVCDFNEVNDLINYTYNKNYYKLLIYLSLSWLGNKLVLHPFKLQHLNAYDYEILKKLTIFMYYVENFRETGYLLTESLIVNHSKSQLATLNIDFNMLHTNKEFYIEKINYKKCHQLILKNYSLLYPKNEGLSYQPINPSILRIDSGYMVNCRLINYLHETGVAWEFLDLDQKIRSRNIILIFDDHFNKVDEYELVDDSWRREQKSKDVYALGLEDLILFKKNDDIWISFTSLDTEPVGAIKQNIGLLKLVNGHYIISEVQSMETDYGFERSEKNWLPFVPHENTIEDFKNEIKFIYWHTEDGVQLVNYQINNFNQQIIKVGFEQIDQGHKVPGCLLYRGSAPPITFKHSEIDGYLSVVHEVINHGQKLSYVHRFIFYDRHVKICAISKLFYFDHKGVEFCRGMCYNQNEKEVILSVGIKDAEAKLYIVDIDVISSMMINIDRLIIS